jgi:hypothetical protein
MRRAAHLEQVNKRENGMNFVELRFLCDLHFESFAMNNEADSSWTIRGSEGADLTASGAGAGRAGR